MGQRVNLSTQVTDCKDKRSDSLVFSDLYLIERTECVSAKDFLDEPLAKFQVKRSQDRDAYLELPPERVGYGGEDIYCRAPHPAALSSLVSTEIRRGHIPGTLPSTIREIPMEITTGRVLC